MSDHEVRVSNYQIASGSTPGSAVHTLESEYDVLICGAGLAGLTLARQLKLELPALSIAVIDRLARPLPEAAHKVGESTVELSACYFGKVLRLEDYLAQRQLPKLGLRFFFGNAHGSFEERPELGISLYGILPTYQLDRGRLENDLRQMAAEMGVEVIEGAIVDTIDLADDAELHEVRCRRDSRQFTLRGRWVVDALGRRRLLASKLGLRLPNGHAASAAWWRVDARLDVAEMGVNGDARWRRRVIEDRYLSTNHLMGMGYWVWFIPLASGATSIGIVTDETIHPFASYGKSYVQALAWLRSHEPAAWQLVKDYEPLDFGHLKNYSYNTRQIFSHRRWSCVGEAGFFLDPLYSPGSDFIAVENTITAEMIRRDIQGELTEAAVDDFNRLVLDFLASNALHYFKGTYSVFGHAHIFTAKHAWDVAVYWATTTQLFVQDIVRRPSADVFVLLRRYEDLNARVQQLFIDWAAAVPARAPFAHADITRMRFLQMLHLDLAARRSREQFLDVARKNLDLLEEIAQLLFWQAVAECLPERMPPHRSRPPWVNSWGISLNPELWEADGLYKPSTVRGSGRPMRNMYAGVFAPMTLRELVQVELPYRIWLAGRGKLIPPLVRFLHRFLICDRPAMWLRRLFVADSPSPPAHAGVRETFCGESAELRRFWREPATSL
jgi:flavin-dependent dehydrogenase